VIDFFKESEKLLTELPTLRRAVDNLIARKSDLAKMAKGKPAENKRKNAALDTNEKIYLEHCLTGRQIGFTKTTIAGIESALEQLGSEDRAILTLWYIDRKSKEQILEDMHVESLSTLYSLRNRAVKRFTMLYFGA
jgi:hypothetical protein